MSVVIVLKRTSPLLRAMFDGGLGDVRWRGEPPPDPLGVGKWSLSLDRLSTRVTEVEATDDELRVRMLAGAADEDVELALTIVRRAAVDPMARVHADIFGDLRVCDLDHAMGSNWRRQQQNSAARVVMTLARERGPIRMPGPTRDVCVGPQVVAELDAIPDEERGAALIQIQRRVLWPDPRYEAAGVFVATAKDGKRSTLTMLLPERACVLPATDQLAVDDGVKPVLLARTALAELGVGATPLDDGNDLVEPVPKSAWPTICARARALAGRA